MQKNRKRKTLQELTLKDNFMFGAVMLEDLGNIPEELRKKIKEEQDMQTMYAGFPCMACQKLLPCRCS